MSNSRMLGAIRTLTSHSYASISGVKLCESFVLLATAELNFRDNNEVSGQLHFLRKILQRSNTKVDPILQEDI